MKSLNSMIAWLYILGTIALGMIIISSALGYSDLSLRLEAIVKEQLSTKIGIWTGAKVFLVGLLFACVRIRNKRKQKSISFDNPEGLVTLSLKAVEDFVKKVGHEYTQVLDMVPTVHSTREGIKVKVRVNLSAGANVPRLTESIQHTIKNRMQNILGIENVNLVEVHVTKLVNKNAKGEEITQQPIDVA